MGNIRWEMSNGYKTFSVSGPVRSVELEITCGEHGRHQSDCWFGKKTQTVETVDYETALLMFVENNLVDPNTGRYAWWICERGTLDVYNPARIEAKDVNILGDDWAKLNLSWRLDTADYHMGCCDQEPTTIWADIDVEVHAHNPDTGTCWLCDS